MVTRSTVTLVLDGRPTLDDYVKALANFQEMVHLASGDAPIVWEIEGLEVGSTLTTAVGISDDEVSLTRSTAEIVQIGREMRDSGAAPAGKYNRPASGLLSILNGRVPNFRIENETDDVTITGGGTGVISVPAVQSNVIEFGPTRGAVEGRIQTVSNRGSLRFTLYDLAYDKAVSCYLQPSQEDLLRDAWGRIAIVEGMVRRDPATGRPTTIRQVTGIDLRDDGMPGAWRQVAGLLRAVGSNEPTEATIRRLRDAE